jgi:hypothetical protein
MRRQPKTRWLDRCVATAGPYMALCLSEEEFREAIRPLGSSEVPEWCGKHARMHALHNHEGDQVCIVCLNDWQGRDPISVACLLVHEAVHVWQAYADDIGERTPGSEQEAYAIQNIAQTLMEDFRRRMKWSLAEGALA